MVIISPIISNDPYREGHLIAFTVLVDGHFFYFRCGEWNIHKKTLDEFYLAIAYKTIYLNNGKPIVDHLKRFTPSFRPKDIVDHAQMADVQGISRSIDTLAQFCVGENFCLRTSASPREKSVTEVRKNHLLIESQLFLNFAAPLPSTSAWAKARDRTLEIYYQSGRKKEFFRKRKLADSN